VSVDPLVSIHLEVVSTRKELEEAKRGSHRAVLHAVHRMALFVEARAVIHAPAASGRLRAEIHATDPTYLDLTNTAVAKVIAGAAYSVFVEQGFKGHFVPFHVAESLYFEAISRWGWRVPTPDQVHHFVPGRRYLIPTGKKSPVWGVYIRGDAQPFLKPSLKELMTNHAEIKILSEEYDKEFARLELHLR
jgi:fermentation-respiration switch protein FrsA (DUF1100 family)